MQRENKKRWEKINKLNLKYYTLIHHHEGDKLDPYNVLYNDMLYDVDKVIDIRCTVRYGSCAVVIAYHAIAVFGLVGGGVGGGRTIVFKNCSVWSDLSYGLS